MLWLEAGNERLNGTKTLYHTLLTTWMRMGTRTVFNDHNTQKVYSFKCNYNSGSEAASNTTSCINVQNWSLKGNSDWNIYWLKPKYADLYLSSRKQHTPFALTLCLLFTNKVNGKQGQNRRWYSYNTFVLPSHPVECEQGGKSCCFFFPPQRPSLICGGTESSLSIAAKQLTSGDVYRESDGQNMWLITHPQSLTLLPIVLREPPPKT